MRLRFRVTTIPLSASLSSKTASLSITNLALQCTNPSTSSRVRNRTSIPQGDALGLAGSLCLVMYVLYGVNLQPSLGEVDLGDLIKTKSPEYYAPLSNLSDSPEVQPRKRIIALCALIDIVFGMCSERPGF